MRGGRGRTKNQQVGQKILQKKDWIYNELCDNKKYENQNINKINGVINASNDTNKMKGIIGKNANDLFVNSINNDNTINNIYVHNIDIETIKHNTYCESNKKLENAQNITEIEIAKECAKDNNNVNKKSELNNRGNIMRKYSICKSKNSNLVTKKGNVSAYNKNLFINSIMHILLWFFVIVLSALVICFVNEHNKVLNANNNIIAVDATQDDGTTAIDFAGGTGDPDNPYQIATPMQLRLLSTDSSYWADNFVQTADITYTTDSWTHIGNYDTPFVGNYDGGGHSITFSKTVTIDSGNDTGFFGYIIGNENAELTIQNLSVNWAGTDYVAVGDKEYKGLVVLSSYSVGGIISCTEYVKIINCHTAGTINTFDSGAVGGILGLRDSTSTIENCSNSSTINFISSDSIIYVGGIVGEGSSDITNCYNTGTISVNAVDPYVGGIAGSASNITNCYNTGTIVVSSENEICVGGIGGECHDKISNCYNTGTINVTNSGGVAIYLGGIVGKGSSDTTNCYNTGTINITNYVEIYNVNLGGVVGGGDAYNCYNTGTINFTNYVEIYNVNLGGVVGKGGAYNCYNIGTINVTNDGDYSAIVLGGIVGYNSSRVSNCYNTGIINVTDSGIECHSVVYGITYSSPAQNCAYSYPQEESSINGIVYNPNLKSEDFKELSTYQGGNPNYVWAENFESESGEIINTKWDFENLWAMHSQINQGYPYFNGYEYTVTFKPEYDNTEDKVFNLSKGEKYKLTNEGFEREGYILSWIVNGIEYQLGDIVSIDDNTTFTAKWVQVKEVNFSITTNVGVIFYVYDAQNNFVLQTFVDKKVGVAQEFKIQLLVGEEYHILISAFGITNISLDVSSMAGVSLNGRELAFVVLDGQNDIIMNFFGVNTGIIV